jgi:ATP/maltotriose-dependent transcriptional regulator MalT
LFVPALTVPTIERSPENCAYTLRNLGQIALDRYHYAAARLRLEEAVACSREVDDRLGMAIARHLLGWIAFFQGDYMGAQSMAEEGLVAFRKLDEQRGIAGSLELLGRTVFASRGDQARASPLLEESLALYRQVGDVSAIADALVSLGQLVLHRGDVAMARALAEESFGMYREIGSRLGSAHSLALLAKVEVHQGDYVAAHARYEEGLVIAREVSDKLYIASGLEGVASLAVVQGEPAWAARLWGAAETLRETIGSPLPPVERAGYERSVTAARIQLGDKAFDAAWAKGRSTTPEQVLAAQETAETEEIPTVSASSPTAKTSPSYPAGLTTREVEVLRLVAQGLSDAQVAERLVISRRTVNWHLTSVYSKLQVSSRAAATRYAIEHTLV